LPRRYYVSFIDDKTRYGHAYFLHKKSGTFDAYKQFEAHLHTQYSSPIKTLCSDRGGEYFDKEFVWHLKSPRTKQKMAVHDTQSENGVAERFNHVILERVRAMLHASGLPHFLWAEAARHAVWLQNRMTTQALDNMTPWEAITG
jgi:hypothetical protein